MKLRYLAILAAVPLLLPVGHSLTQLASNTKVAYAEPAPELIAQATDSPESGGPRKGRRFQKLVEELDLTSEQQEAIRAIREEARSEKQALRQQMRQERETMRTLLASDTSRDELRSQHQKMLALRQDMATKRFETMLDVRDQLTPEQRAKFAELRGKHRGRHGRRGRWGR